MQYVGETKQKFSYRMNGHRSKITTQIDNIVSLHFNNGCCNLDHFMAQPIEKLPGTDSKKLRKDRELYWMKELRTLVPYGMNDRCQIKYLPKILYLILLLFSIKFPLLHA